MKLCHRLLLLAAGLASWAAAQEPLVIGDHRQLFVDNYLVGSLHQAELLLHHPVKKEIVLIRDQPWEGSQSDFERLIKVGDVIRLYYMAGEATNEDGTKMGGPIVACCAESLDGIHWVKPDLGIWEYQGSKHNNIVWMADKLDNFTPFRDTNPDCPPDERFKATTAGGGHKLRALKSPDGIHWSYLQQEPIITHGRFDTQNTAFWDPLRHHYWCYLRGFHDPNGNLVANTSTGVRDIRVSTSTDFRHWTEPKLLRYPDSPDEALYTNQIEPYYRAPEIFVGFPTRYTDRHHFSAEAMRSLPDPQHRQNRMKFNPRYGTVVTDGQFMTSRDGYVFHRWDETFIRPGPERKDNWLYGDGYQSQGLIETAADDPTAANELSCYATEDEWKHPTKLRRFTIRIDGFVSVHAKRGPGELVTEPFIFSGRKLSMNFSTAGGGSIYVEILGADGNPAAGFARSDCDELFGDTLDRTVTWHDSSDVSALAGKPVRLRVTLRDADLYSLVFEP